MQPGLLQTNRQNRQLMHKPEGIGRAVRGVAYGLLHPRWEFKQTLLLFFALRRGITPFLRTGIWIILIEGFIKLVDFLNYFDQCVTCLS